MPEEGRKEGRAEEILEVIMGDIIPKLVTDIKMQIQKVQIVQNKVSTRKRKKTEPTYLGEGDGNPLQYFCLENPMDGGAW